MQAFQFTAPGLEHLVRADLADPRPAAGEVVVRHGAATLNYLDLAAATGAYPGIAFPFVPVADAAGTIAAVGDGVDDWSVGDRVVPHFKGAWTAGPVGPWASHDLRGIDRPGSLAAFSTASAASLVRVPEHLTDLEAAALPIAATTAWNGLRAAAVGPGDTVLLLGTGGVSIAALQLAKAAGARVIVTSSSDAKRERARALGADETINYRDTPAWEREVLRLTDGEGVRLVVESGGAETFARSIASTAYGGTVFTIGFVTGTQVTIDVLAVMGRGIRIVGNNTGSVADLAAVTRAIAAHRIRPVVDTVFDWTEARDAYRALQSGRHVGKVGIAIAA